MNRKKIIFSIAAIVFLVFPRALWAVTLFSDGFESGLGSWALVDPALHWQSSEAAHSGTYSHKIQDIGTLGEIASRDFTPPESGQVYLSFWWMLTGASDTSGKLGRFVGQSFPAQMEIWWSNDSHYIAIHHYNTDSLLPECGVDTNRVHYTGTSIFDENWHHFEIFIDYNTPGLDDGILKVWLDRPAGASFDEAAYLKVNDTDVRYMNSGACETYYTNLRLPTNIDSRMQPGSIYYDDVELLDSLPEEENDTESPVAPIGLMVQ